MDRAFSREAFPAVLAILRSVCYKTRVIPAAEFRQALELDQNLAGAHYGLAFLLQKRGDPDGAMQHLRAFLAQPPKGPDAHRWIEHATHALRELGSAPPAAASPPRRLSAEAP